MRAQLDRSIQRAMGQIRQAFRGVLTALDTSPPVQLAQADALAGEQLQAAELFQHYGLTSAVPAGAQVIVLPLGGKTVHAVIIGTEHASYRLTGLESGEVALYDDQGQKIVLKRGRVVEVHTDTLVVNASAKVTFNTPLVETSGELETVGDITDRRDEQEQSMSAMRNVYDIHTHNESNVTGAPTDQPNQLMGGA